MTKIKKEFIHILFSLAIITAVVVLGIFAMYSIVSAALHKTHNTNTLFSVIRNTWCHDVIDEPPLTKDDKIVVLRLDDVQAFAWSDISMKMIRDAYAYNAPVVAGVIPKTLKEEATIVNFLKREKCNIEIAIHGWDHYGKPPEIVGTPYVTEFWQISFEKAKQRIGSGIMELQRYNGKKAPITFIPPFNDISGPARAAAEELWIQVVSSIGSGLYDYHSTTYNFDKKRIVPVEMIIEECQKTFSTQSICVIMMHPQDYSNEEKQLDEKLYHDYYIGLLEFLKKSNVKFATFEQLKQAGF